MKLLKISKSRAKAKAGCLKIRNYWKLHFFIHSVAGGI